MEYISNDEYRQMAINHTSGKVDDLERKVNNLTIQVNNLQKQLDWFIRNFKVDNES